MAGREEHPAFEAVAHLVHLVLDGDHFASEPGVVVQQCGVGEAHGHFGEVFHLDEYVYGLLQLC